jgi:hypothetical protein
VDPSGTHAELQVHGVLPVSLRLWLLASCPSQCALVLMCAQEPRGDALSTACLAQAQQLGATRGALEWAAADHLQRLAAAPYAASAPAERLFVSQFWREALNFGSRPPRAPGFRQDLWKMVNGFLAQWKKEGSRLRRLTTSAGRHQPSTSAGRGHSTTQAGREEQRQQEAHRAGGVV